MISAYLIVWFTFLHFIFDFMMQDDKTACNKSKNFLILCKHCFMYSLCGLFVPGMTFGGLFILFGSHVLIDFVSSKVTSYFWLKEDRHNFFVTVGFDQFLHFSILVYILKFWIV